HAPDRQGRQRLGHERAAVPPLHQRLRPAAGGLVADRPHLVGGGTGDGAEVVVAAGAAGQGRGGHLGPGGAVPVVRDRGTVAVLRADRPDVGGGQRGDPAQVPAGRGLRYRHHRPRGTVVVHGERVGDAARVGGVAVVPDRPHVRRPGAGDGRQRVATVARRGRGDLAPRGAVPVQREHV